MNEKIVEMLHLSLEPVGIFLGNTSAICELKASPRKRNCVIPFVLAAAKGKITSLDEDGCTCPGGAVGACFGDGFSRLNPNIHVMLSQGLGEKAPAEAPPMLKEGERFFCDAETALKWRNNMPFWVADICCNTFRDRFCLQFSIFCCLLCSGISHVNYCWRKVRSLNTSF